jgi:hypothetical protein
MSILSGMGRLSCTPGQVRHQACLKIPGVNGYIIESLKTVDLNAAVTEAEDLFYGLRAEQKQGLDVQRAGNLRFKDLWDRFYGVH